MVIHISHPAAVKAKLFRGFSDSPASRYLRLCETGHSRSLPWSSAPVSRSPTYRITWPACVIAA